MRNSTICKTSSSRQERRAGDIYALSSLGETEQLLLDTLLKGTLILASVSLLSLAFYRASAALRHFVWLLGVLAVLALPLLASHLPALQVSWFPKWAAPPAPVMDEPINEPDPRARVVAFAPTHIELHRGENLVAPPPVSPVDGSHTAEDGALLIPETRPRESVTASAPPDTAFLNYPFIWLGGSLLCLMPILVGLARLTGITQRADRMEEGRQQEFAAAARRLGVRRAKALISGEGRMPMTLGW